MNQVKFFAIALCLFIAPLLASAQVDEDKLGAWYMYFYDVKIKDTGFGVQGDVQFRNWNLGGDLEQILLRSGVTYRPKNANKLKVTLGYANITTGQYGIDFKETTTESRIYQEALFPVKFGNRVFTNHRFRYEQRFVENQDFRTRYRYTLFINVPLNKETLEKNAVYLALYNEIFINGQRDIGNGRTVEIFDRNRAYAAIGYVLLDNLKIQLGIMNQTTDSWSKNQLQLGVLQAF